MVYIHSLIYRLVLYSYLLYRGRREMSPRSYQWLRRILFGEATLALLGVLVHRYIQHPLMSLYMSIGLFIFFSLGYASVFAVVLDALRLLDRRYWHRYDRWPRGVRLWISRAVFAVSAIIFFSTMYFGYRNVRYPEVVRERLFIERLTPEGQVAEHRMRLALLTDLHIGEGITPGYIERAVNLTLAERPDLILVGGDYIDHALEYADQEAVRTAMGRLRAPYGTYYVLGNHEYRADTLGNMTWVERMGGQLLVDSVAYPADSLVALIGRDDYVHRSRATLEQLTAGIETSRPVLLLEHTPEAIDSLRTSPVDLALYGHTHGGQLWPMPALIWLRYGVVSGRYQIGRTAVHVSSGVGAAGAPYRFGTRSQIVIYDLYW